MEGRVVDVIEFSPNESTSGDPEDYQAKYTIFMHSDEEVEQMETMLEAYKIFLSRKVVYGEGGWKTYGAMGAAFFLKDRANRVWRSMRDRHVINEDDALDLINIATFAVRSDREGNVGGEFWPDDNRVD